MSARVISIANSKGGVGKTTTCVSLAEAFAANGFRTLVVDLDTQANASLLVFGHEGDEHLFHASSMITSRFPTGCWRISSRASTSACQTSSSPTPLT